MSYNFKKLTFLYKNPPITHIDNMKVEEGQQVHFVIPNKKEMEFFKKILCGKIKNATGRYRVDHLDIIDKNYIKYNIEFIKKVNWFRKLLPVRLFIKISLLSNGKFIRKSLINMTENLYDYYSFIETKNEMNDLTLRKNIDKLVQKYIKKISTMEYQNITNIHYKKILNWSEKNIKYFDDFNPQLYALYKATFMNKLNILFKTLLLMFDQSIIDNIYKYYNLRYTCTCEYNASNSSNRKIRKLWKKFSYSQCDFFIQKYVALLNSKITGFRIDIINNYQKFKSLKKHFHFELRKYFKNKKVSSKERKEILKYVNDSYDLLDKKIESIENLKKQSYLIINQQEFYNLGKEIGYLIHQYHLKVQYADFEYSVDYKELKNEYKNKINSVFKQFGNWTSSNIEKYNIQFDWYVNGGFNVSQTEFIYLKILKALHLKKNNIIFSNFMEDINKDNINRLKNTVNKILEYNKNMSIIFLDNNLEKISDLSKKIYVVENKKLISVNCSDAYKIFANSQDKIDFNVFKYNISNNQYFHEFNGSIFKNIFINKTGMIWINPFKIYEYKKDKKSVPINVRIINSEKFLDKNIHCGIINEIKRVYFYSKKEYAHDDKLILYFNFESIEKIE